MGLLRRLGDHGQVPDGVFVTAEVVICAAEEVVHGDAEVGADVELAQGKEVIDRALVVAQQITNVPGPEEAVLDARAVGEFPPEGDEFGQGTLELALTAQLKVRDGKLVASLLAAGVGGVVLEEPAVLGDGGFVDADLEELFRELELEVGVGLFGRVLSSGGQGAEAA
jgi:hypothetical protein